MQPMGVDEAAQSAAVPLGVQQLPSRVRGRRLPGIPLWLRLLRSTFVTAGKIGLGFFC